MTTFDSNYAYNMATQLAGFDTQYSYNRLDRNKKNYQAQQTALNTLSSALSTFQSKLSSLKGTGSASSMVQNKATLSSADYATATVGGKAQAGSYLFHVAQLASKDQVALQELSNASLVDADGKALGGKLMFGTVEVDLTNITTLDELAKAINAKDVGVQASLVRTGDEVNLVFSSEETGSANAIPTMSSTNAALQTAIEGKKQLSVAKDAIVYLGSPEFKADDTIDDTKSVRLTNSSNTFTDIADGVSLTFTKTHKQGDAPLSVDIAQDTGATKAKVQEFVDAYNSLISTIKTLTATGSADTERGALAADGMTRGIKSMVDNLIRQEISIGGEKLSLVSLGITTTRTGTLELNAERFDKMLASKPEALDALLLKGDGADKKGLLDALLDTQKGLAVYTNSVNGILKSRKDGIVDSMKRVETEYERVDAQYDNLYQRYLEQYTSMMQIMSTLNQTSSLFFSTDTKSA